MAVRRQTITELKAAGKYPAVVKEIAERHIRENKDGRNLLFGDYYHPEMVPCMGIVNTRKAAQGRDQLIEDVDKARKAMKRKARNAGGK